MTDYFLLVRLKLPNALISIAILLFASDFHSPCFDVPKAPNLSSGGVQNREIKNRRLRMIVASFQDFKLGEKTDFADIFFISYKQRTIVPFLSELISSQ